MFVKFPWDLSYNWDDFITFVTLVNNDFQINKCTIILQVDERLCYVLPILSIPYFTISSYNRVILSINFFLMISFDLI